MRKKLLIVIGPQGSGNHVWSKIFALHSVVFGWRDLLEEYWLPHSKEPFAEYWQNPEKLNEFDWSQSNYYVTSISNPYIYNKKTLTPDYKNFYKNARVYTDIRVAIIGRDKDILASQQKRVRNKITLDRESLKEALGYSMSMPVFLSTENLFLYEEQYLRSLSTELMFPISYQDIRIPEILKENPNKKYIKDIEAQPLDDEVKKVSNLIL